MSTQQVAIITGAADGIGKAIAIRLASDGYDVVVADLPRQRSSVDGVVEQIKTTTGRKAIAFDVDVCKEDQVKALVQAAVDQLGGLDVVSLEDGIYRPIFADLTLFIDDCECRSFCHDLASGQ